MARASEELAKIAAVELEVDGEYQSKQGNYNVYLKGIFKILCLIARRPLE